MGVSIEIQEEYIKREYIRETLLLVLAAHLGEGTNSLMNPLIAVDLLAALEGLGDMLGVGIDDVVDNQLGSVRTACGKSNDDLY